MKPKRIMFLLLMTISLIQGRTVNLLGISQKDSSDRYYLTLSFDGPPEYVTSQKFDPPTFELKLVGARWDQGDYSKWTNTEPLIKYVLKTSKGGFAKPVIDIKFFLTQPISIELSMSNETDLVLSWGISKEIISPQQRKVEISEEETIFSQRVSLNFKSAALFDVVRLLTEANDLNVILGNEFVDAGTVTLALDNVLLQTALDAILKVNGYEWFMQEDIIIVKSNEEQFIGELASEIYELEYGDAQIIGPALAGVLTNRGMATPFSSRVGGEADYLLIKDRISAFHQIEKVIKQLDKPQKQVNIAIKFMETTLKEEEHLGIDWSFRAEAMGPFPSDSLPETFDFGKLAGGMKGLNAVQLTTPLLSMLMKILAADNSAKLLQEPHVTTFNNQTASINVGTTIPILVPQGQGSVFGTNPYTFEDQSVNIALDVTPRINADDYISLKIVASVQAIIGYVGPDADRPSISSRDMNTSVMVKSGGSLLIGGLIFEDNNLSISKVPFLGDIPILKSFFSSTIERTDQRELLVFITPSIVY